MTSAPENLVAELAKANERFVHALALRFAPAPGLAEDIAQQVFLEFISKATEWDLTKDIKPLLAVMTRHVANRCWRERMRSLPEVQQAVAEHIRQLAEGRDVSWFGEEEKSVLRRCLQRLPEKSRQLVDWHYYLELSSVEIATRIGMNADAVRRALFRQRQQLRKCMQGFLRDVSL
jgi:RNA polymerase sigma-70 factor (ECF subfamily)